MDAMEWGIAHGACLEGLEARKSYSTQPEWWQGCQRGDWMIEQLKKLPEAQLQEAMTALLRAVNKIVARASANADAKTAQAKKYAAAWAADAAYAAEAADAAGAADAAARLAATDAADAVYAATDAAYAAAWAADAAYAAELSLQADDIRAEIPEWIWE